MRLNAKIFSIADGQTPVETQEFDNRLVEIYYINDYPQLFNQYLPKGRFAIWASNDGFNYRLFVEKGYYEELGELYSDRVNKVWLDFWDKCDDLTKKYNFRIMLPVAITCLVLFLLTSFLRVSWGMWLQLGLLAIFIIAMMMINKTVRNKITEVNNDSVTDIKKIVGSARFDELLEEQKKYIDEFCNQQAKLAEEEAAREEEQENAAASDEVRSEDLVENNVENEENTDAAEPVSEVEEPTTAEAEPETVEVEAEIVDNSTEENKNN